MACIALLATILLTSCTPHPADTAAGTNAASATPALTSTELSPETVPQDAVTESMASLKALHSAEVQFATNAIDNLTASSYVAEVSPGAVVGTANLLVDGKRQQTDFRIEHGQLWVQSVNGIMESVGPAQGKLNPAALLGGNGGIAKVLASLADPAFAEPRLQSTPSLVGGRPLVKILATLPASAATVLLPADSLAGHDTLPVTLWLDREAGYIPIQLIAAVGEGSLALSIYPTR